MPIAYALLMILPLVPLHERVTAFFQCHVDGNFRKALNELVAEDAQDIYLSGHKTRFKSFRIERIRYVPGDFTKAKVTLSTEVSWEWRLHHLTSRVSTIASWKLVSGKWMWYFDPADLKGPMDEPSGVTGITQNGGGSIQLPNLGQENVDKAASQLVAPAKVDKTEVVLALDQPSVDVVTLHNNAPGFINVAVQPFSQVAGLKFELDKSQVGPNGDAKLKVTYTPPKDRANQPLTARATLVVEPFQQQFELTIRVR